MFPKLEESKAGNAEAGLRQCNELWPDSGFEHSVFNRLQLSRTLLHTHWFEQCWMVALFRFWRWAHSRETWTGCKLILISEQEGDTSRALYLCACWHFGVEIMKPPSLMKRGVSKGVLRGRRDLTLKLHRVVREGSCCFPCRSTRKRRGTGRNFEVTSRTYRFKSAQQENTHSKSFESSAPKA